MTSTNFEGLALVTLVIVSSIFMVFYDGLCACSVRKGDRFDVQTLQFFRSGASWSVLGDVVCPWRSIFIVFYHGLCPCSVRKGGLLPVEVDFHRVLRRFVSLSRPEGWPIRRTNPICGLPGGGQDRPFLGANEEPFGAILG